MAFDRTARSFLLSELLSGMWLTLKYMFGPKVTVNYPFEKGPLRAMLSMLVMPWPPRLVRRYSKALLRLP